MFALTNLRYTAEDRQLAGKSILIDKGQIVDIMESVPPGVETVNCAGGLLSPGFIDLQIYGAGGHLFSAAPSESALRAIEDTLLRTGTTAFLICLATNTDDIVYRSLDVLKARRGQERNCLGVHLEGPFLNPEKRGAHISSYIRKASLEELRRLVEYGEGTIKMMTIAPELQDDDVLAFLAEQDILLSLGHSNATYAEATNAYNTGFQTTTHLFNAMSAFQHRAPGIPAAVFQHPTAMASIIADGFHVDFEVVAIAKRLMGDRLFLITDAVTECSTGPYQHRATDGRFLMPDGTLSGSALTMALAVRNCIDKCGISREEALRMATTYPARLIGLEVGVSRGSAANLVVLDESMTVQQIVFNGELIN